MEARLKQLQDDYDTLSDQAQFSQSRAQDLETALNQTTEELSLTEEQLVETERRAEGEEFFKLAQEAISVQAKEACAERDEIIEGLAEDLEAAQGYAEGLRALLAAREQQEGGGKAGCGWAVERAVEVGKAETESREVMSAGAMMCRELIGECESAADRAEGLEQTLEELVGDEDRLVEEVYGLEHRIQELEVIQVSEGVA